MGVATKFPQVIISGTAIGKQCLSQLMSTVTWSNPVCQGIGVGKIWCEPRGTEPHEESKKHF